MLERIMRWYLSPLGRAIWDSLHINEWTIDRNGYSIKLWNEKAQMGLWIRKPQKMQVVLTRELHQEDWSVEILYLDSLEREILYWRMNKKFNEEFANIINMRSMCNGNSNV